MRCGSWQVPHPAAEEALSLILGKIIFFLKQDLFSFLNTF